MARSDSHLLRALALAVVAVLAVAACGSTATSPSTAAASPGQSGAPSAAPSAGESAAAGHAGGTIYWLQTGAEFNQVDPQRAYTGEDLAFFGATIYRALEAYTLSPDDPTASKLVPDLATDLGTPTDGGKTWSFTLRDGVTFQDGSPITCADIAYGVSRTFATDVINQGPTYAIAYLDIPTDADGSSSYKGPYKGTGQDLFDKAVTCDGKTITFHLNAPHGDFNYTTTLGFSPVPKAADTGETYGVAKPPVSSGPYQVESYTTGNGGKMVLVRNPNWSQASDPYRTPYPDKWEVDFGLDSKVIDQRLIQSSGNDQTAVGPNAVQPENLGTVFSDPSTPTDKFKGRAVSGYDIYSIYLWINVKKVPNVKIRQAVAVALDRSAMRKNAGGDFYGDYSDGAIKPNIGQDYAPTGLWTDFFGKAVPDTGDPELAKQLIKDSGEPAPTLTYNFADTPTRQKEAAIIIDSLGKAGITVKPAPLERGKYYSVVFDPAKAGDFGYGGWGADWPNASTVIAPLFTQEGGWDLSQVEDADFNTKVAAAQEELDRAKQATLWQALNKQASENVWIIPTFFELAQRMTGTKIAPVYIWGPYGSWPYGAMYVLP